MTVRELSPMATAYLDLMEKVLTGTITDDPPLLTPPHRDFINSVSQALGNSGDLGDDVLGRYHPEWREQGMDWPSTAFTMVGARRLRNFRDLIGRCMAEGIDGDILETGVWRGGASILARAVLKAWDDDKRRVYVADSFEGLPPPSLAQDAGSKLHEMRELAISLETVQANFAKFGLLDEQVVFLKGWFKDTMPVAPISRLAVMRLDGDMYESTMDPLVHMYDRLSPGGFVIIDDYFIPSCEAAVSDFLAQRSLSPELVKIDTFSCYFRKDP